MVSFVNVYTFKYEGDYGFFFSNLWLTYFLLLLYLNDLSFKTIFDIFCGNNNSIETKYQVQINIYT